MPRWSAAFYATLFACLLPQLCAGDALEYHYDLAQPSGSLVSQLREEFVPLERVRRDADGKKQDKTKDSKDDDDDQDDFPMRTMPPDYEKDDAEDDNKSSEHIYYNMTVKSNPSDFASKYYVDMEKWLNGTPGVQGSTNHEHLTHSYRKAAGVKFHFKFPFYGHRLNNVTIATGGFCYVGEYTHSWLAATQYIAPLMANFETYSPNSSIMYGDDGEKMIVEWSRVSLRDNKQAGEFTFQAHLFRSGDIWFVYKDIPIAVQNISDMQHPCKLGISDAYLFNHKVNPNDKPSLLQPSARRVIHEYHRITVRPEEVKSGTVVVLTALPTCLNLTSCHECTNTQLKHFQCSWCTPKQADEHESGEDADSTPFCSDQIGLNRRRQKWVESNCAAEKKNQYCGVETPLAGEGNASVSTASVTTPNPQSSTSSPATAVGGKSKVGKAEEKKAEEEKSSGGGTAFLSILVIIAIGCVFWVVYAFYNPHTPSGQLLIKYRPSKWQIPSGHVRYSANMHI